MILGVILQAGCGADTASPSQPDTESRPNIVWLIAEDLSAIELGIYGNTARGAYTDPVEMPGKGELRLDFTNTRYHRLSCRVFSRCNTSVKTGRLSILLVG